MIEIKDLLSRFRHILFSGEVKKESVREVISRIIKIQIKKEDIEIKNGTVYLNIKPIYKNEIFLKKEQIFLELKKSLGDRSPDDFTQLGRNFKNRGTFSFVVDGIVRNYCYFIFSL
jgi:hypothetical protein